MYRHTPDAHAQILSSLPRTGTKLNAPTSDAGWSPTASAHQQDVGVILPALTPGLGVPVPASAAAATSPSGGSEISESGDDIARGKGSVEGRWEGEEGVMEDRVGRLRLGAMKALSTFAWPAPPSLCHPGSGVAEKAVHGMACFGEEEGQAALVSALERCVYVSRPAEGSLQGETRRKIDLIIREIDGESPPPPPQACQG